MTSPDAAPPYQAPAPQRPTTQYPADGVPVTPIPRDPGYINVPNPDGSDIGPLNMSPEGEKWVNENVIQPGYVIDWGTREIIDPYTGEVKGTVPASVPRMI